MSCHNDPEFTRRLEKRDSVYTHPSRSQRALIPEVAIRRLRVRKRSLWVAYLKISSTTRVKNSDSVPEWLPSRSQPLLEASRVLDSNGTEHGPQDSNRSRIHPVMSDPLLPHLTRYLV
jgi:hypothetical protein